MPVKDKCNYYYRGGLCANSAMENPFCVGEENCSVLTPAKPGNVTESSLTVIEKDDMMSQWLGVYCPHYQRFYCTGEGDGCKTGSCATAEHYLKSLTEYMERA